jgi:hypothetical protein
MAIISIPTSIGGVSIPGLVVNGPLSALFGNKFGRQDLQYPRDLQSATRGHYIKFTIQEITKPANYETKIEQSIGGIGREFGGDDTFNALTQGADSARSALGNAANQFGAAISSINPFNSDPSLVQKLANLTKPQKHIAATVSLYIPETVNFTYAAQYDKLSLSTAAQNNPLIGKVAKPVLGNLETGGVTRLVARGLGLAFNPHQQILFNGIDFRTYQMAFTFTPYSKQEAETVEKIIKLFKFHAAPRLATGIGMFFVPPSTFTPQFFFNGRENKKINKITESVIESIDVNYAPNGFTTMSDGAATQIQLTINFREIELITREKIEQGY